ncbi:excalibur calcium-binding domain-containing protein [Streptococcus sp. E17BB]|uniref:excalibur calcium-binding domain-containing protein n=1 Tax=Streptococcus sp. E17BB TaxID=3278714 RepID=UPI00359DE83A
MKKITPLKAFLYLLGGILLLSLIIALLPLVFFLGVIGTWYYSKRQPNPDKRKKYISLLAIGGLGTLLLAPSYFSENTPNQTKPTSTVLTSQSSNSSAVKKEIGNKQTDSSSFIPESTTTTVSETEQNQKQIAEVAKQAEKEKLAAEKEEAERKAAEEAARKAEEERLAAELAEAQHQAEEQEATIVSQQQGFVQAPATVRYANCSEARAAGVTPIYLGEPGYSRKLDRDGDGIACE